MDPEEVLDIYSVVSEFYDHIVPYRDRQDVNFFVELARQANGRVLEVGCGSGRVLIPTARAGVDIVGLDLSHSMLSICRKKLSEEPEEVQARVQLVEGVRELPSTSWEALFRHICCRRPSILLSVCTLFSH